MIIVYIDSVSVLSYNVNIYSVYEYIFS